MQNSHNTFAILAYDHLLFWAELAFQLPTRPQGNSISVVSLAHKRARTHTTTDQSHRYGRPREACREPAGSYDKTTRTAICFEHKT